jgi:hypothetical protein
MWYRASNPALHIGLNVRPPVDDAAGEMLGQVIRIFGVEGRHLSGLTGFVRVFPSFENVTHGAIVGGTEHCVAAGKGACASVWP